MARIIETSAERESRFEELLAELREIHSDRDFHELPGGGWLTLPKGTEFTYAMTLSSLAAKLPDEEQAP